MKKIFIFTFFFLQSLFFGHHQDTHRYIVLQAWELLKHQCPEYYTSTMASFIGDMDSKTYLTNIVAGAHNEDQHVLVQSKLDKCPV